jgi:hypothetical protein
MMSSYLSGHDIIRGQLLNIILRDSQNSLTVFRSPKNSFIILNTKTCLNYHWIGLGEVIFVAVFNINMKSILNLSKQNVFEKYFMIEINDKSFVIWIILGYSHLYSEDSLYFLNCLKKMVAFSSFFSLYYSLLSKTPPEFVK